MFTAANAATDQFSLGKNHVLFASIIIVESAPTWRNRNLKPNDYATGARRDQQEQHKTGQADNGYVCAEEEKELQV
jgi:hypothetical protein